MKTRSKPIYLSKQRGMGATIILFTIALIVLVGGALAYASRSNPRAINTQGAKVYAGVLLKQSADYRDAFSRFVFDGGEGASMTFNSAGLFDPAKQYGVYQSPPPQAITDAERTNSAWKYKGSIVVAGIGTGSADSVAYVGNLTEATCREINVQLHGVPLTQAIPVNATPLDPLTAIDDTAAATTATATNGRSSGCFKASDGPYVFYTTLGEA